MTARLARHDGGVVDESAGYARSIVCGGLSKKLGGVTDCDAGDTCSRTPQISRRAAQTHPRRFYFVWTSKTGVCLINLQRALVNNLWWLSLWRKASRPRTIDVKTVRLTATHSHSELEFFSRADL